MLGRKILILKLYSKNRPRLPKGPKTYIAAINIQLDMYLESRKVEFNGKILEFILF